MVNVVALRFSISNTRLLLESTSYQLLLSFESTLHGYLYFEHSLILLFYYALHQLN
jgi:hypothetical protein